MRARVPLDVDLEDRLLYGLTPVRLAYVVLAGLAALALWSSEWMPIVLRGALAVAAVVCGGAMAWVAGADGPPTLGRSTPASSCSAHIA